MTVKERLATLPDGQWLLIVGTRMEHMITGTHLVGVLKNGTVCVRYTDGMTEERMGTDALLGTMDADNPSLFALVEYVQDGRTMPGNTPAHRLEPAPQG